MTSVMSDTALFFNDDIFVIIYNVRVMLRHVKYLNKYINKNKQCDVETVIKLTGSKRGLIKYERRLVRLLNSLIKMIDMEKISIRKIISMSDRFNETKLSISEIEEKINNSSDFIEALRLAEKLKEERF